MNPTDIQIAYVGGGSKAWAWKLMIDLALESELAGNVRLYDIDLPAARRNESIGNRVSEHPESRGKWRYRAVESLRESLDGADFVIVSILPGTFTEMGSDVHQGEKYGIYQSVGDTVGPGGLMRALRTIPMLAEIAEGIKQHAPGAWVINYTNPMTLCTRTLYEVFPEIKAFGCCHEVLAVQTLLATMLDEMEGIPGVPREEITTNILGINHFTWIDQASYRDRDLIPLYTQFVEKHVEDGFEPDGTGSWKESVFSSANRVKFDLFLRYGLIAAAGDRHLAEFVPSPYLKDPATAEKWKFHLTPVSWRVEDREMKLRRAAKLARGEENLELEPSGEEGVMQIKALAGLGDLVSNVNLPNQGQMPDLPPGAVVETNALFSRNSVRPILAGKLPVEINGLVLRHVCNQETTLKAAFSRSRDLALHALIQDPLVTIDVDDAERLLDEMLRNTAEYLPDWDLAR